MTNPANYGIASWLFARALGMIYFIAFASLIKQIKPLIGERGIAPVQTYLGHMAQLYEKNRLLRVPTIFWWRSDDRCLVGVCLAGCAFSVLAIAGIFQSLAFVLTFACYLSIVTVGQDFMSFQWDSLLLETGFLAIFLAPFSQIHSVAALVAPPLAIWWVLWWLLFRVHFSSGLVKITSRDLSWRKLEAMRFHYETQPLPNGLSWLMHQLPPWYQSGSAGLMFFIELVVPFFIFLPAPFCLIAAGFILLLQVLIILTGNYGFFNWLSIVLTLPLWRNSFLIRLKFAPPGANLQSLVSETPVTLNILSLLLFSVSLIWIYGALLPRKPLPKAWLPLLRALLPFHLVNTYGLFAVMTTYRPEIIIEGSEDGESWLAYEFKYKPGSLTKRPPFVAPHQPRLDWQMWFAATDTFDNNIWLQNLFVRLLQHDAEVLKLLAHRPFENEPPAYLRALLYDYRFTSRAERESSGHFWKRQLVIEYSPVISLAPGDDA